MSAATYAARLLLEKAAGIPDDDLVSTPQDVRALLLSIADEVDQPTFPRTAAEQTRLQHVMAPEVLHEQLGLHLTRAEAVASDYERCVQVSQTLADAAARADARGRHAMAETLRVYAFAVSQAGNAL